MESEEKDMWTMFWQLMIVPGIALGSALIISLFDYADDEE